MPYLRSISGPENGVADGPDVDIYLRSADEPALLRALDAYRQYMEKATTTFIEPRRRRLQQLQPEEQSQALWYGKVLDNVERAAIANAEIATDIYQRGCEHFAKVIEAVGCPQQWHGTATDFDCAIARSCVRALFRDWSSGAQGERDAAHGPVIRVLKQEYNSRPDQTRLRVLIPGVGLGRLVQSVSELGYSVEGNDVSYHTLLARLYVFTQATEASPPPQRALHPWALDFSNHISREDQMEEVSIPDIQVNGRLHFGREPTPDGGKNIAFTTGGFVETYNTPLYANAFTSLVTCYFIDTAPNFLSYLETAWNCLEVGGLWINIGPLLWNAEENGPAGKGEGDASEQEAAKQDPDPAQPLLELSADEVIMLVSNKGFAIEENSSNIGASPYVGNRRSMLQYTYHMAFWVARKLPREQV